MPACKSGSEQKKRFASSNRRHVICVPNEKPTGKITAAISLSVFAALPALCWAQDRPTPPPTPTIAPTPTPAVTPTPAKPTIPYGTPANNTPDPSPTIIPPAGKPAYVDVRQQDQPPSGDPQHGTTLQWVVYQPGTMGPDGTSRWPVVVVLHIGGFKGGDFYHGLSTAPEDLAAAGFYVVVADYPLAPPHSIAGQYAIQQTDPTHSGRYPQQTRAIEALIDAAKNDPHCYHQLVGVLGGSGGASHAAYIGLDVTSTGALWPYWSFLAGPKCVVCLSGQYDFSDRDPDVIATRNFVPDIENYTNSAVPYTQWADSPVSLVSSTASFSFIPMYFLRSMADSGSPLSTQTIFGMRLLRLTPTRSFFECGHFLRWRTWITPSLSGRTLPTTPQTIRA